MCLLDGNTHGLANPGPTDVELREKALARKVLAMPQLPVLLT